MRFEALWALVRRSNKYIDENTPWALAKKEEEERLALFNNLCNRCVLSRSLPFMPRTPERIWSQLGIGSEVNLHMGKPAGVGAVKTGEQSSHRGSFPELIRVGVKLLSRDWR